MDRTEAMIEIQLGYGLIIPPGVTAAGYLWERLLAMSTGLDDWMGM